MNAIANIVRRMSLQEFLDWEPGGRWQLVNGAAEEMAPTSPDHGRILMAVGRLIDEHLERAGDRQCAMVEAGVQPPVFAELNVRIPDIVVGPTDIPTGQRLIVDPVLVVEILSPSNEAETWSNVWACTSIPSLQEVLIVESEAIGASLVRRGAAGAWPAEPATIRDGVVTLASIGLSFPLARLYRTTSLRAG